MSSGKGKNDPGSVPIARGIHFSGGARFESQSKMCMSGKCGCIGISVVTVGEPFDIIRKVIVEAIKRNACDC
jgi:hypothetical protein